MQVSKIIRAKSGAVTLVLVFCAALLAAASDVFGVAAQQQQTPKPAAPAQQQIAARPTAAEISEEAKRATEGIDAKQFDQIKDVRLRKAYRRTHAAAMRLVATKVDTSQANKMLDEFDRALAAQEKEEARAGFTHKDCTNGFNACQSDCPGLFCGCRLQRARCTWLASKNYFPK